MSMIFDKKGVDRLGKEGWLKMYRLMKWWESESGQMWLSRNLQHLEAVMDGTR